MSRTILRETRKVFVENINKNYITREELNKYLNPSKPKETIDNSNRVNYNNKHFHTSPKNKTIHTDELKFKEWYDGNKFEIDLVFSSLLGIYTSRKVEFYETHNELYSLFVKKYYRKVNNT